MLGDDSLRGRWGEREAERETVTEREREREGLSHRIPTHSPRGRGRHFSHHVEGPGGARGRGQAGAGPGEPWVRVWLEELLPEHKGHTAGGTSGWERATRTSPTHR